SIIFNDYSTTRTSALPLQDALPISSLILALAGCAGTADRESTGEYIDDAAITAHVKTALIRQDEVKARNINVETFRGTVQLSGLDRKSTRLNSSHVTISYAVFCLKK